MDSDAFKKGGVQLLNSANRESTAMSCADAEPLYCHRSLIADYLILQGVEVSHLIAPGQTLPHSLRQEIRWESQQLVYDRLATEDLAIDAEGNTP